ncbi:magnesium transporter [Crocosphaera watsonii WH 8501]|uniref:Magnesium transporter MgtE n=2 Tax=Crocosphaera watsonii TaxID=263511 RepID=Q4C628_CROWT|nr:MULTISPECIES: magnesium transporter [Crocosphaera]EAM51575.1 Divalent cation transporter [Crocosphaera watsonii WH 8501]EHJ11909.1 Magnesium transporter [Crocosphaera watsonii WH 0003]MCH2243057.1 magnesium transporter [Crocosphaera sp.]NQZ63603.1 magnesium transporter [Crocosphaera sp.]
MNDRVLDFSQGSRSNLRDVINKQLLIFLEAKNYEAAKTLLIPVASVDIAEAIADLPKTMQIIAFRLLNKQEAIEVYKYLDKATQQSLIEDFKDTEAVEIINNMSPDERVKLLDELPPQLVRKLVAQLTPQEREFNALLLGYDANTAGRIMTPEYIYVKENITVTEAQTKIRNLANEIEVAYYIYVTDDNKRLKGTLSLKDLIIANPETIISEIMTINIIYAYTNTDQEEVAKLIQRYDLIALPIVDQDENLLGVVTVDDVIDILEAEATEDIYKMGAIEAAEEDENYFKLGFYKVTKKRIPWLLILLVTNSVTVFLMSNFEEVLEEVVTLAFFTPLLIDAGGNVGAQSSTVIIRGLSTDELRDKQPFPIIIKELITGGLLGIILAIFVIVLIFLLLGKLEIGLTVGFSLIAITIIAATTGAALPFLFNKMGFDPALMSAPFITTVVDILGIFVYFSIAKLILNI